MRVFNPCAFLNASEFVYYALGGVFLQTTLPLIEPLKGYVIAALVFAVSQFAQNVFMKAVGVS